MTAPRKAPFKLGPVSLDVPVILAPMAGYTDAPFRSMCARYGCHLAFTEMINTDALVRSSKRTLQMLTVRGDESPVAAHLYGSDPSTFAEAAVIVSELGRFAFIDINAGCPVRKIVRRGAGAGLMADPARLSSVVTATRKGTHLPVTVKTRIGIVPDSNLAHELAHAAGDAGAVALTVHARFASVQHNGPADWDTLHSLVEMATIPVIGNGGVTSPRDAQRMIAETGVSAVMVGRAAIGNPWFFARTAAAWKDDSFEELDPETKRSDILEHLERLIRLRESDPPARRRIQRTPEETAVLQFRPHLFGYLRGMRGWGSVRKGLDSMRSRDAVRSALDIVDIG